MLKGAKERNAWLDEVSGCKTNLEAFNYLAKEKAYFDIVRLFGSYWRLSWYLIHYFNEIVEPDRNKNSMQNA